MDLNAGASVGSHGSFFSRSSTASLAESEIEEACRNHVGIITKQMLEDARRVKNVVVEREAVADNGEVASPRKRRFYAMTTDSMGREKALDGVWIDSLQELLDEANRAYGGKNEWHDQLRQEEQNEQKTQIFNKFIQFSYSGSDGIESIMEQLNQVFKCLSASNQKEADVPSDLDVASLEAVDQTLKEARDVGCAHAEKVTRQWFNYLAKEVYHVERFGDIEVKDLETLKHRLKLLYMYDELNERWHRMDALNAGLEEAVSSKTALEASVHSAELLLVKQVEAEYQKSFEKETKAMILKVAKQRAETIAQVESCLRHRLNLRNELQRILTDLSEKLRQWHPKVCKKFSDAIYQLKAGRKRMEEQLRAADQRVRVLQQKKATTQSALEVLLKPYSGAGTKLDVYAGLPTRDQLVNQIFTLVAKLEEPLVSPIITEAVERLISRNPHEKMEDVAKNLMPKPKEARGVLDFKSIQQLLQFSSAALANDDLAPFLAANQKLAPLLLRGPDSTRLAEMIKEFREALIDRNSHASVKLLMSAEPFLKVLSKLKEELQQDSVAAEVGLILAMATFGAVVRVQRGCQLMAAILNVRSLQLRKHALNRILSEPFPAQTYENMKAEVRKIEASYLAMEGGISSLRKQAESVAKDAGNLLKLYGKQIDDLVQVTKRLSPKTHQAYGRRMSNTEVDFSRPDFSPRRHEENLAYLPALLTFQKTTSPESSGGCRIMTILQYQKALLKLQLSVRKWLRNALRPNLADEQLEQSEEAVEHMRNFWRKRHPEYEESSGSSDLAQDQTSMSGGDSPFAVRQRSASVNFFDREISHGAGSDGREEGNEELSMGRGVSGASTEGLGGPSICPPQFRRWSDILHDRQLQTFQLSSTFQEQLARSREMAAPDISSSSSGSKPSEVEVEAEDPEVKELRSKATFLNWSRSGRSAKAGKKGRCKGLALAKAKAASTPKTASKAEDKRAVYMNLMGQEVVQPEVRNEDRDSEGSDGSETYETGSEDSADLGLPRVLPRNPEVAPDIATEDQTHIASQRVLMEIPKTLTRREVPRHPPANSVSLMLGEPGRDHGGSPGTGSPAGELRPGPRGRLFSPRAPGDPTGFRLEGVKVMKRRKQTAYEEPSETSSEEGTQEAKETKEQKLHGFRSARTPTLVEGSRSHLDLEPFLMVEDRSQSEASESLSHETQELQELGEASPSRSSQVFGPGALSPGGNRVLVSPGASSQLPASEPPASRPSSEGPSPNHGGTASMTETTRWLLEVLDAEKQHNLAARQSQVPRTGRAFVGGSEPVDVTSSGPPGTARRMKLRERSGPSRPSTAPIVQAHGIEAEAGSSAPGPAEWRCLPRAPGGDWKLLAEAPAAPVEAAEAMEPVEEAPQVVRIMSQSFDFHQFAAATGPAAASAAATGPARGARRPYLGRARMYVSSSNWNLPPSPPSSAAGSDDGTLNETVRTVVSDGTAGGVVPTVTDVSDGMQEPAELGPSPGPGGLGSAPRPGSAAKPGPERQGLPMTRRGVVQLLGPQHEVEPTDLALVGASVRPRRPRVLLPRQSGAEGDAAEAKAPAEAKAAAPEAVELPIFDVAEAPGVQRIQSAASLENLLSLENRPPRHGVTMTGEVEDLSAELGALGAFFTENGSLRPAHRELDLSFIAQQAVAAAAEENAGPASADAAPEDVPKVRPSIVIVKDPVEPRKEPRAQSHPKPRVNVEAQQGGPAVGRPPWERWKPRPNLSQLVAGSTAVADPQSSSVEDHLKSWRTRPVSARSGPNSTRPPFGSKTPRRGI